MKTENSAAVFKVMDLALPIRDDAAREPAPA
jgi:hypothetical protein